MRTCSHSARYTPRTDSKNRRTVPAVQDEEHVQLPEARHAHRPDLGSPMESWGKQEIWLSAQPACFGGKQETGPLHVDTDRERLHIHPLRPGGRQAVAGPMVYRVGEAFPLTD